jgi:hypothetical protein
LDDSTAGLHNGGQSGRIFGTAKKEMIQEYVLERSLWKDVGGGEESSLNSHKKEDPTDRDANSANLKFVEKLLDDDC